MVEVALGDEVPQLEAVALAEGVVDDDELYLHLLGQDVLDVDAHGLPEKMKIKLVIVNHSLGQSHRFDLRYFITEGHIDHWLYSTPESRKRIETDFAVAACNPV